MYEGKLVRLRAYRKEDIPLAQQWLNEPDMKLNLAPGVPYPYTLEDEEKWYASNSSMNDAYIFAIETVATGEYIGGCGVNSVDWKNSFAHVGIAVCNREYLGKGYGTEAMRLLVDFIFNEMNLHKVCLYVYEFNERAIKSYLKCGFVLEGTLRDQVFKAGRYWNQLSMGILRDEWLAAKQPR
jgi:RimJ/RimL family protein N-acetyltransferase